MPHKKYKTDKGEKWDLFHLVDAVKAIRNALEPGRNTQTQGWGVPSHIIRRANQAQQDKIDPWGELVRLRKQQAERFNSGPNQVSPMVPGVSKAIQNYLGPLEHRAYAQDTASRGPIGVLQMLMGTPIHTGLKAAGIRGKKKTASDPSLRELVGGLQGTIRGLSARR